MEAIQIGTLGASMVIIAIAMAIGGRRNGQVGYWAWSWGALIAAGMLLELGADWVPTSAAGAICAALFPGLQLAGSIEYVERPVPRWLIPAVCGIAALRVAAVIAGFPAAGHLIVWPFEIGFLIAASFVIYRSSAPRARTAIERVLVAGFVAIAVAETADAGLDFLQVDGPGVSWIAWLGIGIPVGGSQIVAKLDQIRRRLAVSLSEREAALQELEESNERFFAIAEHAHDVIVEGDSEARICYANPRIHQVLGYTPREVLGLDLRDLARNANDLPTRAELQEDGHFASRPIEIKHRDGSFRWLDASARAYQREGEPRVVVIARDVTKRLRDEEELRKAQKLESLGLLAGGIAHDFNNLLTGILGNADSALGHLTEDDPERSSLALIVDSAEHAAQLTRQLQAYAGGNPFEIRPVDVSETLRSRKELLRTAVGDNVRFELELADGLPTTEGDPTQLFQAVLNLAINGAEACGESTGTVRISTGCVRMESPLPVPATGSLEEGSYVFIEVGDTGSGVDPSIQDRIFDPFFSTKGAGHGLGLAVVHGLVRTLRGAITVDVESDEGTRCRLLLPVSNRIVGAKASPTDLRPSIDGARILAVDDNRGVLKVVRTVLEADGYVVDSAEDGRAAEKIMSEHGSEIALVLLDAVMPGESGEIVLDRLRAHRTDVPVVLMSGYAESEATRRFSAGGEFARFLAKPFRARALLSTVHDVLDGCQPR